jgi:hypothetical protein
MIVMKSVALASKCLLIVIQITPFYIWRWTPGPAPAHGLSRGCPGPGPRLGPGLVAGPGQQPPLRRWPGPGLGSTTKYINM